MFSGQIFDVLASFEGVKNELKGLQGCKVLEISQKRIPTSQLSTYIHVTLLVEIGVYIL